MNGVPSVLALSAITIRQRERERRRGTRAGGGCSTPARSARCDRDDDVDVGRGCAEARGGASGARGGRGHGTSLGAAWEIDGRRLRAAESAATQATPSRVAGGSGTPGADAAGMSTATRLPAAAHRAARRLSRALALLASRPELAALLVLAAVL